MVTEKRKRLKKANKWKAKLQKKERRPKLRLSFMMRKEYAGKVCDMRQKGRKRNLRSNCCNCTYSMEGSKRLQGALRARVLLRNLIGSGILIDGYFIWEERPFMKVGGHKVTGRDG